MAYSLKENLMKEDRLSGGHRMCAGCGSPIAVRTVLRALDPEDKAVVCSATSCLEVSTFMYPYTAWKDSFIHNAFENAAATLSGVETAYRAMKKRGKIDDTYSFIAYRIEKDIVHLSIIMSHTVWKDALFKIIPDPAASFFVCVKKVKFGFDLCTSAFHISFDGVGRHDVMRGVLGAENAARQKK